MSNILRYAIGSAEYLVQHEALNPQGIARFRNQLVAGRALWFVVSAVGLFAAMRAHMELVAIGFVILGLTQLVQAALYRRHYQEQVVVAIAAMPQREVELVVEESGLREKVEGIESFAPWRSLLSYIETDKVLLIRLTAGLWSVIPNSAFATVGQITYDEFLGLLASNGVQREKL